LRKFTAFAAALLVLSPALFAQFDAGAVLGTVRDASGAGVPEASMTLHNDATGIETKTSTGDDGNYEFPNVKIGSYTVTAGKTGFAQAAAKGITVNVNARQRVDLTLQVGAQAQSVEVEAGAPILETDSSERGQVINSAQVAELPLNGRAYSDLALLSPGVHRSNLLTQQGTPREGAFNVNGLRSVFNNFLLDGSDNNAYGTSNQGFANQVAQPSPDAVAEFKVITNNYSAEYGRSGGAVINVATRSGTNQLHGTAYEFLRNTDLNAIGYIFGARPATFKKPTLQRNQFGATIGGPFIKNRLFFFSDYEGFRELQKTLAFASLPSLTDRQGVLPLTVTNPLTGAVYPANTPLPASDTSAFARKVLNDLPTPTGAGRSNNYQTLRLDRNYNDKYDAKLDGQINSQSSAFIRFSQRKVNVYNEPTIPGLSGGNSNGFTRILNQQAVAGYTWIPSSTSVLEGRLGFSRTRAGKQPPLIGGPSMFDLYGITGLPASPELTGGLTAQSLPGFDQFGRQATNPQFQNPLLWDPKINYSQVIGRHALKLGYEWQIVRTQVEDINPLYGRDTYGGQFSKPATGAATGSAAQQTYGLADFFFGLRSQYALANYVVGNYRQHMQFMYVQDDWRLTNRLTLNLGLRFEFATPRWDRDNVLSNFDPQTNTILAARDGDTYDRSLMLNDAGNFAPRVGLAYSVTSRTVLRGGYGISYVHFNRVGSADLLGINGPQVVIATVDQTPSQPAFLTTQLGYPVGLTDPKSFNPVKSNITFIPKDLKWPYVQSYFFSVQHEIGRNLVLDVAYVGNQSDRLPIIGDYNAAVPGTGSLQSRRPITGFGAITWLDPAGFSNYNSLQVKVEKRLSSGLYFLNSFTYGHAIDNGNQSLENPNGNATAPQNIRNLDAEKGTSAYDQKFTNITSVVYSLPFGRGRRYASGMPAVADAVLGGWELTGINTALSGEPITLTFDPTAALDETGRIPDFRGGATYRPNLIGDPLAASGQRSVDNYFNKSNVLIPSDPMHPFGNAGRNIVRGYPFNQLDLGVFKNFRLPREGMSVQFRSEFFNLLNHTNFRAPNSNASSSAFGTIRSTYPARQIQFALKFLF
jgi:hypothetical protein